MPPIILRCGFTDVMCADGYRRESELSKGRKLSNAKYVYEVEEAVFRRDSDCDLSAKCQAPYDVNLQVSVFKWR